MQLDGKIAIVTGGGRGIGRAIVERFLAEGARVVVAQRSALQGDWPAPQNLAHIQADLADPGVYGAIVRCAVERFGGLDILVNNSGMMFESTVEAMALLLLCLQGRCPRPDPGHGGGSGTVRHPL